MFSLMFQRAELIREIELFSSKTGLAESSIGSLSVKDSRTVARLRAGRGVSLTTVERLRAYMAFELVRRGFAGELSAAHSAAPPDAAAGAP